MRCAGRRGAGEWASQSGVVCAGMRACVFVVVVTKAGLGGAALGDLLQLVTLRLNSRCVARRAPAWPPPLPLSEAPPCKLPLDGPRFLLSKRWLNQLCPSIRPASLSLSFFLCSDQQGAANDFVCKAHAFLSACKQ